ncbi:MAG: hypothetical protein WDZ74_02435 [Candidatus Paceibacterota bacterium]
MSKYIFLLFGMGAFFFAFVEKTFAVCPLCTIAVGAGVGFSQWLGIDDVIAGLWIGGLTVSMIIWTENWLERRNVRFKGRMIVNAVAYYALIVVPLFFTGLIGNPANVVGLGLDKLLLGIITGSIAFWFGASWYYYIKEKNNGHAYFPFQKVVMPIAPLAVLSILFYFLTL